MMDGRTNRGGRWMPSTDWPQILLAVGDAVDARSAMDALLRRYVAAMVAHLAAKRSVALGDAEELVQGFVTDQILQGRLLSRADPDRGKFRNFILTSLDHYVANRLRGDGRQKRAPQHASSLPSDTPVVVHHRGPAEEFEVAWAKRVVEDAVERMKAECERLRQTSVWEMFVARVLAPLFDGTQAEAYDSLVKRLCIATPHQAANLVVTGKRRFARTLREVVGEYVSNPAEIDREIRDLQTILASGRA